MDKVLTYSMIAAVVSIAVPFFSRGRNFYFFSFLVVVAGSIIAIWANANSEVTPSDYTQHEIFIEHAVFDAKKEQLVIVADGKRLLLSNHSLSRADIAVVAEAASNLSGNVTMWLRDSNLVSGINASNLSIDPKAFAEREASFYSRLRNVGLIISLFGLFMVGFSYLTRTIDTETLLTRKY